MTPPDPAPAVDALAARLQGALGDGYTVERELGGGGMSRVFVATDNGLSRRVVVKVLREDVVEGISRERFRREVLVSANLQHPNIVGVIAAGDAEGLPFFVMPFVDGESLRASIVRNGPASVPNAVAILRDIARALAFAHGRGIVHRDIKPDNVLLAGGAAMVADFGVAKALASARASERHPHGSLTGAGMSLGTPAYMAPEQVAGDPAMDHRADLYAFGVTAYELLAGEAPFAHRSPAEQMSAHLVEVPALVSTKRPGVPTALVQLIARCLEKEANDRPQTAGELLALLDDPAVVSGEVASASIPSLTARRRPKSRVLFAAMAATVVGMAGWGLWTWGANSREAVSAAPVAMALAPGTAGLAIFPLVTIGSDSSAQFVAAGLTEALTNAFAGLPGLRVASRSALDAARSGNLDVSAAVKRLGVSMYVEGTVQVASNRVRATVRVVDANDGFTLWSDVYERGTDDLLTAQSEIASAIADAFAQGAMDRSTAPPR